MKNNSLTGQIFESDRPQLISKRELSVLMLIAEGYSSSQIASQLFLSYETIASHRKNMMKKLAVSNTASLITTSFRTGLLTA